MNQLVPNPKHLSENIERIWAVVGKRKDWEVMLAAALEEGANEPQWTPEEAEAVAATINPLVSGADPLEVHLPFVSSMRDDWVALDADDLWDRSTGWVWGRVVETKYNQVGDFHNGAEPTEEEKVKMGWGRRYANLNVEDRSGRNQRVKVDIDIFETFRHIVDKGNAVIAFHASFGKQYKSIRASYLVDLDELQAKINNGQELTNLEMSLWAGWTPGEPGNVKQNGAIVTVEAMVARVAEKTDKKGQKMAFISLLCQDGKDRELICFGSSWPTFSNRVKQGKVARFKVEKDKKAYILSSEVQGAMVEM